MQTECRRTVLRLAVGTIVALLLLSLVAKLAAFDAPDFSKISVPFAILAVALSGVTIALRAATYRTTYNGVVGSPLEWLSTAARHQFVFSAFPSGLGDLGFPAIAKSTIGIPLNEGMRIILVSRLRDIGVLAALALFSASMLSLLPAWFGILATLPAAVAFFAEPLASHLVFRSRWRAKQPINARRSTVSRQTLCFFLSLSSWLAATSSVMAACASAGWIASPMEAIFLIAMLNASGIIAISFGGLGVAELGAMAALVMIGLPTGLAGEVSLLARPVLLFSVLSASFALAIGQNWLKNVRHVQQTEASQMEQ